MYDELKKTTEEKNYLELKKQIDKIDELIKLASELSKTMPAEETGEKKEDILDVEPEKNNE
jgi:hypothetical protein